MVVSGIGTIGSPLVTAVGGREGFFVQEPGRRRSSCRRAVLCRKTQKRGRWNRAIAALTTMYVARTQVLGDGRERRCSNAPSSIRDLAANEAYAHRLGGPPALRRLSPLPCKAAAPKGPAF